MQNNPQKSNTLISCGSYSWGGLEMFSLETARKLADKGMNIKILCSTDSRLCREAEVNGIETLPYFGKNVNIPASINKLRKYLKNSNTNVIHSNHSHDLWVLTPALKWAGSKTKLFLTKHMASGVKKNDLMHRYLYNRIDGVFAISTYIQQSVKNTTPVPENKIILLPVGIDVVRFNKNRFNAKEVKMELGLPVDKLIIGIVGRMTPGKGHEEFLEAAKILNTKYEDRIFFLVIGSASFGEAEYEKRIRTIAVKLNLKNIKFMGHAEIPEKSMTAIDILSFPSHDESFGRVLLEAMALEIPTAASGFAGVLDITIENETGLLFKPKDASSQADALEKLITNKELRDKFALAGRKRAEEVFTIELMINNLIKHYTS
ncbi:MAG: glycosyltransferase family 4 protein [Ignavibacteria bacterium]|nr:glycosyltransferase family 4 protein [Ignavibacteria bacterium]